MRLGVLFNSIYKEKIMTNINEKYFDTLKQKKALEHLERVWKNKVCECCGHNKWTLAEDLVMPMIFTGGELQIGGPTYP